MNNSYSILLNTSSYSHASLWEEAAAILSGLIGGGLYGLKIRIPHSFGEFRFVSFRCLDFVQNYLWNWNAELIYSSPKFRFVSVMTFLFGNHLSLREKIKVVAQVAGEHATNLAAFACLYKVGAKFNNELCYTGADFSIRFSSVISTLYLPLCLLDDVGLTQSCKPKTETGCSSWCFVSTE